SRTEGGKVKAFPKKRFTHALRQDNQERTRTKRARAPNGPAPSEGQVSSSVRPPRAARSSSPRGQAHGKANFGFRRFRNAMVAAMVAVDQRPDADLSSAARRWRGARERSREGRKMDGPQTTIH